MPRSGCIDRTPSSSQSQLQIHEALYRPLYCNYNLLVGHGDVLLSELALALVCAGLALALQDGLAVLVKLELGDHALGGVDTDLDSGTYIMQMA